MHVCDSISPINYPALFLSCHRCDRHWWCVALRLCCNYRMVVITVSTGLWIRGENNSGGVYDVAFLLHISPGSDILHLSPENPTITAIYSTASCYCEGSLLCCLLSAVLSRQTWHSLIIHLLRCLFRRLLSVPSSRFHLEKKWVFVQN